MSSVDHADMFSWKVKFSCSKSVDVGDDASNIVHRSKKMVGFFLPSYTVEITNLRT